MLIEFLHFSGNLCRFFAGWICSFCCCLLPSDFSKKVLGHTVHGRNPANQLRLVVFYPVMYRVLYIPGGAGFLRCTSSTVAAHSESAIKISRLGSILFDSAKVPTQHSIGLLLVNTVYRYMIYCIVYIYICILKVHAHTMHILKVYVSNYKYMYIYGIIKLNMMHIYLHFVRK